MGRKMKKGTALALCLSMLLSMATCQSAKAVAAGPGLATTVSKYKVTIAKSATAAQIQAEINKAYNAGGGVVTLSAGTYELSQPIELKSNVTLQGQGQVATCLKRASNCTIPDGKGVVFSKGGLKNVIVQKLCIDGNADTTPKDSAPSNPVYGLLITDANGATNDKLYFDQFKVKKAHMGFHVKGTYNLYVKNSDFSSSGGHYLYYHNMYLRRVYKAKIWKCNMNYSTSGNGVNISYCEDITLDTCRAYSNYFRGIRAADSKRIDIFGCEVFRNQTGDGIILNSESSGVTDFRVKSCNVYNNGKYGINVNSNCSKGELWYSVDGGGNAAGYLLNQGSGVSVR